MCTSKVDEHGYADVSALPAHLGKKVESPLWISYSESSPLHSHDELMAPGSIISIDESGPGTCTTCHALTLRYAYTEIGLGQIALDVMYTLLGMGHMLMDRSRSLLAVKQEA